MFAVSKAAQAVGSVVLADAIDFDGTNDYLSRNGGLIGAANTKTLTFSFWVYGVGEPSNDGYILMIDNDQNVTQIKIYAANQNLLIEANAYNGPAKAIGVTLPNGNEYNSFLGKTWHHVLFSVDVTGANTSRRHIWVDDINVTNLASWGNFADFTIGLVQQGIVNVMTNNGGASCFDGRLAHFYMDTTYRDLSVEANRRLFITADRKPAANQSALNPILYLPLSDPTQPGKNLGTGGDFALTGVVARSGRGPNQFNAPYSDLDGTADYLSKSQAIVDIKTFIFSATFSYDVAGNNYLASVNPGGNTRLLINAAGGCTFIAYNSAGAQILQVSGAGTPAITVPGRNYHVVASFDMTDSNKAHIFINGVSQTLSVVAYVNDFIRLDGNWTIGSVVGGAAPFNGRLGNVFFDTKYIDLSQPANLAKFVTGTGIDAKPADLGANGEGPFGTPPLIYLPMYGNNAGKNYGTGGDFTVNSGPYPGARGPNEFWGNKADFDGTTGYLSRTSALSGVSDGKTFSCVVWFQLDATGVTHVPFSIGDSNNLEYLYIRITGSNTLQVSARNSSGTVVLNTSISGTYTTATTYCLMISVDLTSTSNRSVYVNNALQTVSWNTYANSNIKFSDAYCTAGAIYNGSGYGNYMNGKLSEFYFTTQYIDFSQEANRLKFRDAFGNPVDLTPQIEAGTLPNPTIYMRFDPANFGKNYGTGGDFTKVGTILDGGQL